MSNYFMDLYHSPLLGTRSVTRYSGQYQSSPESLSDHIVDVSNLSYLISRKLQSLGTVVDIGLLLQRCLVHDCDEVAIGDIPRCTKYSSLECHNILNDLAVITTKRISDEVDNSEYTYVLWSLAKDESVEGYILRISDMLSVCKKVIFEVDFCGNLYFLKIALEVEKYVSDITRKLNETKLEFDGGIVRLSSSGYEYLNKLLIDTVESMRDLTSSNHEYIRRYNLMYDPTDYISNTGR